MAPDTSLHPRRAPRRALVASVALLAVVGVVGCSSSKGDDASSSTTVASSTSSSAGSSTGSSTAGTGTTSSIPDGPLPTSPSTLPTFDSACAALAETYGLDEIQPKNTSSWVDERQRVVVDAQREAGLLGQAQQSAPVDVAPKLALMQAYATWLSGMVGAADSYSSAVTQRDAYPGLVDVSLAVASVRTWQKANCPE
jgi:hypothetical protein